VFSELGTVDMPSLFTGFPSKGHISFPTKKTRVRTGLEEGERGKMGCSGQDRNERPGKI